MQKKFLLAFLFSSFALVLNQFIFSDHFVSAQTTADWYMAGANPQRTSWVSAAASGGMSAAWHRPIEAYIDQKTQVIAVNGKLYLATSKGLLVFNADNGELAWRWDTQLPLGHSPTVYNNVVYIGGFDHKLHALNATNGSYLWSFNGATGGYITSPLVVPNSSNQAVVYIGNRDGYFYAIGGHGHPQQAQQLWRYKTDGQINFSAAYSTFNGSGRIYFASDDNHAYALSTSGTLVWKTKMSSEGFHSWWPVVYKDKIIFAQTNPYRDASISPRTDDSPREIGNVAQVFGDGAISGLRLGPHQNPTTWSDGFYVVDAGELCEAYERFPNSTDTYKHLYWMRPFAALSQDSGQEYEYDSDGDGHGEGLPFSWWAKPGATIYPPVVNTATGKLYAGALFDCCSDVKGKVYGWTDDHPNLFSMTGSTTLSNGLPNQGFGWAAMAEPQALSGGGGLIYRSLCCDRIGDSGKSTASTTDQPSTYWSYNLGGQTPGYDPAWYVDHKAISRHLNWYDGLTDFFPQDMKTYGVIITTSPRAQLLFSPARTGVFGDSQNSVTITVTANWDTNGDSTYEHTENIPVTINKQTGCSENYTSHIVPDPNPGDAYNITVDGRAYCYISNSINGQYGNHSDQNPLVPHQGMIFTHRSNTLVAYKSGGTNQSAGIVNINTPATTSFGTEANEVRSRLEAEVEKIVALYEQNGQFLRPVYTTAMLHNYSQFSDYFTNPGDTMLALSLAYPHISSNLKTRVKTYLAAYLREYFGTDTGYDSAMYSRTGWANLAPRDNTDIPPDITYRIPNLSKTTLVESGNNWSYPPHNFYAMYLYVKNMEPNMAQTLYSKAKSKLQVPPPSPSVGLYPGGLAQLFREETYLHNAWITGYTGFLLLQQEAGMASADSTLRQQVETQRNSLLTLRRDEFNKDSPHAKTGNTYKKTLDLSRNFFHLSPELADYMRQNIPQSRTAITEYEAIAPFWFVAKYEAIFGESGSQNLYQIPALFQAKAWILQLPQQELIKFLDAPAFARGDLYYIQDASILLNASSDPNYTPPPQTPTPAPSATPTPKTGDANGDGKVDGVDYVIWLNNYGRINPTGPSQGDFNSDTKVDGVDYVIWLNNYGK